MIVVSIGLVIANFRKGNLRGRPFRAKYQLKQIRKLDKTPRIHRNVYIDCGGWHGHTVRNFMKTHKNYEVYCFEVNEEYNNNYKDLPITLINKAVWIHNNKVEFYLDDLYAGQGSSVYGDKTTGRMSKTPILVNCIDLSDWILNKFKKTDKIVLKLNVEGAEYKILDKMIKDGSIKYINELYCAFHHKKISSITKEEHDSLIERIPIEIKKHFFS